MSDCTFCGIVAGRKSARVVREWKDVVAFRDKNELVTDGHILVVPRRHVVDATEDPVLSGRVMTSMAQLAREFEFSNFIFNNGRPATQSEFHMHGHLLLRAPQDGLMVPWGTTGNPHAPHACTRALAAEEKLEEMAHSLKALEVLTDILAHYGEPSQIERSRCPWCRSDAFDINHTKRFYHCFKCGRGGSLDDEYWLNKPEEK
jgi:histidine triad (HIT) family protein